jgi:hypothetical protein
MSHKLSVGADTLTIQSKLVDIHPPVPAKDIQVEVYDSNAQKMPVIAVPQLYLLLNPGQNQHDCVALTK